MLLLLFAAVLLMALVLGIGSVISYVMAAAVFALAFSLSRRMFPDRVIEVERAPHSGNAEVDALIAEARTQLDAIARANDVIGITADGKVQILLSQATENDLQFILPRFKDFLVEVK